MNFEPVEFARNYHNFRAVVRGKTKHSILAISDVHIDNPKCQRDKLKQDLDKAKAKGASIVIIGDLFCLMQGKYDKRRSKSAIMPEHLGGDYIDLVIDEATNFFEPYAKNIWLITTGNHESKVSENLETNILARFIERLNLKANSKVQHGAYDGYFTVRFELKNSSQRQTLNVGYSHGRWGGIISKGTQSVSRHASYMPDCEIHLSGHTHDKWIVQNPILRRNTIKQKVETIVQYHCRLGTYKEEFEKGEGWAVERIGMPKASTGGIWIDLEYSKSGIIYECKI